MKTEKHSFSKEDSLALKGVAILLMLFHHCFLKGRFEDVSISLYPFSYDTITTLAAAAKICVSLFVFISGYGLAKTFSVEKMKDAGAAYCERWTVSRLVKLLSGYWLVYVLSCVLCQLIDGRVASIYFQQGLFRGVFCMLADFLGLANELGTPTLNGTWWYMSIAIWFVILIPLCVILCRRFGCFWLLAAVLLISHLPGKDEFSPQSILAWMLPLGIGVVCAEKDWFGRMEGWLQNLPMWKRGMIALAGWLAVIIITWKYDRLTTQVFFGFKWGVYPFLLIVMLWMTVFRMKWIRKILGFLGVYSMDIFLIHSFIRYYYCRDWIYSQKHFALVFLLLLAVSLLLSILLGVIKRLIRFDERVQALCRRIQNGRTRKEA